MNDPGDTTPFQQKTPPVPAPVPNQFCDLVMKGGITSGIVYPLAAAKLSERFVFKNVGGTSTGAIAAAATAAAELARERGGFDRLKELPAFLSGPAPDKKGSNLFAFFQPQPGTARLFRVSIAGLGGGGAAAVRMLWASLLAYPAAALLGVLLPSVFLACAATNARGIFLALCVVLGIPAFLLGLVTGLAAGLTRDAVQALPENLYGLCSGITDNFRTADNERPPNPANRSKPLTYWLTEYLNSFVSRTAADIPLTFGELWGTRDPQAPRQVNLEMMTTCLTHGRPYRLPFRDDDDVREAGLFYFHPDEFRRLFPESIVRWMLEHPAAIADPTTEHGKRAVELRARVAQHGLHPLPAPADLPVAVAVRMSLSFPVLLSAVPLHAIDWSRQQKGEIVPERCWFSDGGVCSNFPIHFFDAPLPRWPTLSIDLVEKPLGTEPETLMQPEMVGSNQAGIRENWNRFEWTEELARPDGTGGVPVLVQREKSSFAKLLGFAGAFIQTMQNWTDSTQSRLPGYRDRIAHVGLTPDEGGLNLNMPPERIDALTKRGGAAAEEFIARFGSPPELGQKMDWANHRWLRMRSWLAAFEVMLRRVERTCAEPQAGDTDYESWIRETSPNTDAPSYPWAGPTQHELAVKTIHTLRGLIEEWQATECSAATKAPRPRPELRPRAQI